MWVKVIRVFEFERDELKGCIFLRIIFFEFERHELKGCIFSRIILANF